MAFTHLHVHTEYSLQQRYSKEKGTGTHMEQNNISEQEK